MSIRLRDLIRAVRQCKTAAEERTVISKESAALRNAFKNQDTAYRHRNVAKLMFIHMLGYPTHFGQMEALKLIAAIGFPEKRIGYLGLMILLDERQEVLMLVTNSLKQDLESRNQHIAGLALTALGNICSTEMARDLSPEVERILSSSKNAYVQKKAALCATRIMRKVPDTIEAYEPLAASLLTDRHHGVLLAAVTLMLEVCALQPSAVKEYRKHVPQLCKVLRSLLMSASTLSGEHDVGGITDPFLQAKLLRLLGVLGAGHAEASDQMSDILAQVATGTEGNRNAGNAILYEMVRTIMGVEATGGLRVLAINVLGRFLANNDNNIRYVALNTLSQVVTVDSQAVQRHRATVVACVKDPDVSIRRRAIELISALVNKGNVEALTTELLDYLKVCDADFKPDLTDKICQLVQRYAPDKRWHIDSLLQVMVQPGAVVKEEVVRALIVLITNAPELHGYASRGLYTALRDNVDKAELALVIAATWVIGEFADLIMAGSPGYVLAGEKAVSATPDEAVELLRKVTQRKDLPSAALEYALTALMKLSTRLADTVQAVTDLVGSYIRDPTLEVQTRACEYSASFSHDAIRPHLFELMPALDEATYSGNLADAHVADATATPAQEAIANGHSSAAQQSDAISALLEMDLLDSGAGAASQGAGTGGNTHLGGPSLLEGLNDLLGSGVAAEGASAPGVQSGQTSHQPSASDGFDLIGSGGDHGASEGGIALQGGSISAPQPSAAGSELDDIFGTASNQLEDTSSFPSIVAWEKDGLRVSFDFSKSSASPQVTDIDATYSNSSSESISDFAVQAAVPKFMTLKLAPANGSSLSPGSTLQQRISVTNGMHGKKALIMRLRISYTSPTEGAQLRQAEVKNFPAGL